MGSAWDLIRRDRHILIVRANTDCLRLSNGTDCLRDAALMQQLGLNTIR